MLYSLVIGSLLFLLNIVYSYNGQVTIGTQQWAELDAALDGSVTLPTDEDYASDYVLWTATYDHIYPEAIVFVESETDASIVMKFLLEHGIDSDGNMVDFVCRNCRHSLAGWSTTSGIVIDTSGIDHLYISDDSTGMVGPGVDLYTFTTWAEEHDLTLPHGDCSSVCFGGFLLGGGFGLTSRTFGLGVDWIKSINVVLPTTGELVTVSGDEDNDYNDLFWALRGGGQGNFGIVTSFEMNIPEKKQTSPGLYVEIVWDFSEDIYEKVSKTWNKHVNNEDYGNHFAMYFRMTPSSWLSLDYSVGLHGFWTGEQVDGLMVLAKVLDEINETPSSAKIDYVPFEGWIDHSSTDRTRYSSHCSSRFAFDSFENSFFDTISQATVNMQAFDDYNSEDDDESTYGIPSLFLFVAPSGGAISSHDTDETVFPWRDSKFFFNVCVRWMNDYDNVKEYAESWLNDLMDNLVSDGHLSTAAFINFPDNTIDDWETAYYGDNYDKLREIKAKYDPNNYFTYTYSVVSINEDAEAAAERQENQKNAEKPNNYKTLVDEWLDKHPDENVDIKRIFNVHSSDSKVNSNDNSGNAIPEWVYYVVIGALAMVLLQVAVVAVKNALYRFKFGKDVTEYTPLNAQETRI